MRKSSGLEVTDRITVTYTSDEKLNNYLEQFYKYIGNEILSDQIIFGKNTEEGYKEEVIIGEYTSNISINKVN